MTTDRNAIVVLATLLALSGCLTLDAKLAPTGEATITMSYVMEKATLPMARQDMQGPHVTVKRAEWADGRGSFDLAVDDAQKLSTSKMFSRAKVGIQDGKAEGTKELNVTIRNERPTRLKPEVIERIGKEVRLTIELPGEVVTSNATSTKGMAATWTIPTDEFLTKPEIVLDAVYKAPPSPKS